MPAIASAAEETTEPPSKSPYQTAWPFVLCVVGLDYMSTLAYQPSVAFAAAGRLAPVATVVVAAVTLFLALPVYWFIAGRSPHGGGSTALLERLVPGWGGKLLVLVLLSLGAVDLVFTRTFSAADAAEHVIHSPLPAWQSTLDSATREGEALRRDLPPGMQRSTNGLWTRQTVATVVVLAVSTLAGLVFFRGHTRGFVRVAVVTVAGYMTLTLIIIGTGAWYLYDHPKLLENWWADVVAGNWGGRHAPGGHPASPTRLVVTSLPLFPYLALGLSGFELAVMAMPLIRGGNGDDPDGLRGRIRNTRLLLVSAAVLMSGYLLVSTLVTTVLIPSTAMTTDGQAKYRALAYLAHGGVMADGTAAAAVSPLFGLAFGTAFDVATVGMLALAGLSVGMTLSAWIPPYLNRLGMEFNWSVKLGALVYVFAAVKFGVVVYYQADLDSQRGAYLTSVLAVFAFAAVSAVLAVWDGRKRRGWPRLLRISPLFALATIVFSLSSLLITVRYPAAFVLAGAFVVVVIGVSIVSRAWRCTELRFVGFDFADKVSKFEWDRLCHSDFPILVPIRPGRGTLRDKEIEIRTLHRIPGSTPIVFVQAELGDPSDFAHRPLLRVTREDGRVVVAITRCVSIPHALAAAALELSAAGAVPEVHFGWSSENPVSANLHFVLFGHGNVPWMVQTLIAGSKVAEGRKPRVLVG